MTNEFTGNGLIANTGAIATEVAQSIAESFNLVAEKGVDVPAELRIATNLPVAISNIETGGDCNLKVGTEAERLALTPFNGLQFNQVNLDNSVTHYSYEGGLWKILVDNYEHVLLIFTVTGGTGSLVGEKVTVTEVGLAAVLYNIVNNVCKFLVPIGTGYNIHYPYLVSYNYLPDLFFTASDINRVLAKSYNYLESNIRSVVLERSNPNNWDTTGPVELVDAILNLYGTYVIDEVHKKYSLLKTTNHSLFLDGTSYTGTYGNVFRRLPRVYYNMTTNTDNEPVLQISNADMWNTGKYWEEDWIGTYKGSLQNSVLVSRPGITTTQNRTMRLFWTDAQVNGVNYGLTNYFDHCKLCALHLAKFGCSNSESTMGVGLANAGSSYFTHTTGTTASLGDATGEAQYLSTSFLMNKLFGIEDLAGSTWEFRPNIRFSNSGATATVYEGNVVSNTATGRTFSKLNNASGAYITQMVLDSYCDFIPKTIDGSSATYYCDGTWTSTSGELLFVGCDSADGSLAGLFSAGSGSAFAGSGATYGARLAFKGNIAEYTLVTGAELAALN